MKKQPKPLKPISPAYARRQLVDLEWLYENTGISREAYDAKRKDKMKF